MTSTHKEILEQANQAISEGDFEGFLAHCTENIVWNFLGDRSIHGKKAVHVWRFENGYLAELNAYVVEKT